MKKMVMESINAAPEPSRAREEQEDDLHATAGQSGMGRGGVPPPGEEVEMEAPGGKHVELILILLLIAAVLFATVKFCR
jgi:hypothetical protein